MRKFAFDDMAETTKKRLANAMLDLLCNRPLSKLTIGDICASCGLRRQSFYYHFRDKYDLAAWIFEQDYLSCCKGGGDLNSEKMMTRLLNRISENIIFYRNAIESPAQNSLGDYILDFYISMEEEALKKSMPCEELSPEMRFAIRSYSYACIMHTRDWIRDPEWSAEQFAHLMYEEMPAFLKEAYRGKLEA